MNKQDYINAVEVLENIINKSNSASIMDSSASRKYLESREYEALKAISDLKLALNNELEKEDMAIRLNAINDEDIEDGQYQ